MYKAIPFIVFESGNYVLHEEAIDFLSNLKKSIGVVSIAGKYRTGKSFFLNRCVLNEPFKKGFNVGCTIQACTKGIWLYSKTVTCKDSKGEFETLVMDTEGIGALDANSTHDSRIFALALLLSSFFIYNSTGSIDESAVSNLSLVSNISKHIKVNSGEEPSTEELGEYFPHFMWMVRDFSLRLINANGQHIESADYLEDALKGEDNVRVALRKSFPHRQCVTMVRPCVDENDLQLMDKKDVNLRPAFVQQMDEVRSLIYKTVPRKSVLGRCLNGPMLAELARCYTNAINDGVAPVIKDSWELLSEVQCRQVLDEALEMFETCLAESNIQVLPEKELEELINVWIGKAFAYFKKNSTEGFREKYGDKLGATLKSRKASIHKTNLAAGDKLMYRILQRMNDEMNDVSTVKEAQDVYKRYGQETLTQLGENWEPRWKSVVAENVWTWMKIISRRFEEANSHLQEKFNMTQRNINTMNQELEQCKVQMEKMRQNKEDLIRDLETKFRASEEHRTRLEQEVCEQKKNVDIARLERRKHEEAHNDEARKELQELQEQLLQVKDEYEKKLAQSGIELELLQQANKDITMKYENWVEEQNKQENAIQSMEMKVKDHTQLSLDLVDARNKLQAAENKLEAVVQEFEQQETNFNMQIQELNKTSNDIITDIRQSALKQRNALTEELNKLKSLLQKEKDAKKSILEDNARKLRILHSQVESAKASEQEVTERYQRELDSSRQELTRMAEQWEHQKESHKDMVKILESHWQDEVTNKRKELEELRGVRKTEKVEFHKRLRETETELVCHKTLLKDNKRKLVDAEEKAGNKKLKTEYDEIKSMYVKATAQLDWFRKSDRELQESVKELRIKNLKLERQCKDVERRREVDILNLKLQYEKQLAANTLS